MAIGFLGMQTPQTPRGMVLHDVSSPSTMGPPGQSEAASLVDRFLQTDNTFPQYHDLLRCSPGCPSVSGLRETDYPPLREFNATMRSISHISGVTTIPLPPALEDQFNHMQQSCDMGIFPEINRAWLAIDSNIFLWSYDNGSDIAYYDRLTETIHGVGLVKPKTGVFKEHVTHLLILTTTSEILLLGVMANDADDSENIHIILEPLFTLPTDNVALNVVAGDDAGRIFLGGRNGCVYEAEYRADQGWFGRKCQKKNLNGNVLSAFLPQFLFSAEDAIEQIEVDNSRHILYTRSESGCIEVYDLGSDGQQASRVCSLSSSSIAREASNIARTVDPTNFNNIVHINAIEETESTFLHLLVVTESGVRLYFSASKNDYLDPRPSSLNLVHIRLPPGFSGSSGIQRPSRVNICHHRRGTTIMVSPQNQENDLLWLLTNDPFSFASELMEISSTHSLSSRVWKMVEETKSQIVRPLNCIRVDGSGRTVAVEPPLIVTQDMEEQRKFVFLSAGGVFLVYKPRPIDHLKKVLIDNQGFDNEAVKGFFLLYGELQAACTALSLACSLSSIQEKQVSEWATLAFFKFAKELEHTSRAPLDQTQMTPQGSGPWPRGLFGSPSSPYQPFTSHEQHFSPTDPSVGVSSSGDINELSTRHNSIYMYFSRIVRPVWNFGVVVHTSAKGPDGSLSEVLSSSVSGPELMIYIQKLKSLKSFLTKNVHLQTSRNNLNQQLLPLTPVQQPSASVVREQTSLNNLLTLMDNSLEIFGLWKVLSDHHFFSSTGHLDQDLRHRLKCVTFRELIISTNVSSELCGKLASLLVQKFIDDNDTTDAISGKLNEACPSIFKHENALFAKAQEKIMKARPNANHVEREQQVDEAASLFKRIGGRLDLRAASSLLRSVGAYRHLIDLCIATAVLRDPQHLAVHFYKNHEPANDSAGSIAFSQRADCYIVLLEAFQELVDQSKLSAQKLSPPSHNKPVSEVNREEASTLADSLLMEALNTPDELLHVACYDWLCSHQMSDRMVHIKSPYLEEYLKRKTSTPSGESSTLMNLLWMFYERNGLYRPAAEILCKLAERHGIDVDLNRRLEYLSRAIVCMKSQNSLSLPESETKHSGEFLHELEEKMDVARLQVKLYEAVKHRPDCEDVIVKLNADLLDITQLYDIAEAKDLPENQLSIIFDANHEDVLLIERLWKNILDKTVDGLRRENSETAQIILENKLRTLAEAYLPSEKFYPLAFIVFYLESKSSLLQLPSPWLAEFLKGIGFSMPVLVEVYHKLYRARGPNYSWNGKEIQLLRILHFIMNQSFLGGSSTDRVSIPKWLDNISGYLLDLQAKVSIPEARSLVTDFEQTRSQLEGWLRNR